VVIRVCQYKIEDIPCDVCWLISQIFKIVIVHEVIEQNGYRSASSQLVLGLLCCFHICLCVPTYHMRNNYVTFSSCHATLLQSTSVIETALCS